MELHRHTVHQLSTLLKEKSLSSLELTQHYLKRISNDTLNSFITVNEEIALSQAKNADEILAKGSGNDLTGIPIAHKDLFCTKNMLTSCGSKILSNFIAPYNATVVKKLNTKGMVVLGKTNMDEFAMGSSNENSYYGPVLNPWNKNYVPGGSSGGSASCVAARLAPIATGTDTGGSVRQPAAFCGITGIKPSYGRVSRFGMVAFASSLDQAGILGQTAQDAALTLSAIAGFDEKDSTCLNKAVPDYANQLTKPLNEITIGLPKEYFIDQLDDQIKSTITHAIEAYRKLGVKFIDVSLPNSEMTVPCYYIIAPAEASSNLSRYDGVRYGYRSEEFEDLNDMYERSRSEGFGSEVKRRIMVGTYVLSAGYYDAYYLKAQRLRRMIAEDFENAFQQCDAILSPTTPTTAFKINSKIDDPVAMYLNDIYTIPANLAGLPAMSLPCGFDAKGLPIGMQLIGKYFDESCLLNLAHHYQLNSDWHQRLPEGI